MTAMTNKVKVWRNIYSFTVETKDFAFEIQVILDLESTRQSCQEAKIVLNGLHD